MISMRYSLLRAAPAALPLAAGALICFACGTNDGDTVGYAETDPADVALADDTEDPFRISLAQWSLNKRYRNEGGDPYDFPAEAKEMGFDGVEYVSALYAADLADEDADQAEHDAAVLAVFDELHARAESAGIEEVLIMVDREGELAAVDESEREAAVANHRAYIDAAAASGIATIRVNAGGESLRAAAQPAVAHAQAVKSLSELGAYAAERGVNVVVENHGGYSSDPTWMRDVMAAVDMDNVGVLPDFGNFCRRRVNPTVWEEGCADEVPADSIYAAVGMWMPYAHAVSAKSYAFDEAGAETKIDYARMMDTVLAYGYDGFVGIEYEGDELGEAEGIIATRRLLQEQM